MIILSACGCHMFPTARWLLLVCGLMLCFYSHSNSKRFESVLGIEFQLRASNSVCDASKCKWSCDYKYYLIPEMKCPDNTLLLAYSIKSSSCHVWRVFLINRRSINNWFGLRSNYIEECHFIAIEIKFSENSVRRIELDVINYLEIEY